MAENSKIEWTHHTFNPWQGCQKVGPGCDHCYAEARDMRFTGGSMWGPHAPRQRTSAANWRQPLKWERDAAAAGERRRVFCASLADVFDNHASILPEWRADLWALIEATPNLDWMLLTKRPGNIANMLPVPFDFDRLYLNVWLGCTVVNQAEADRDIPKLLAVPAKVRFLSMEPLLGAVSLEPWLNPDIFCEGCDDGEGYGNRCGHSDIPRHEQCPWSRAVQVVTEHEPIDQDGCPAAVTCEVQTLDLVIVGGESGPGARPMHPDWARSLRDQCQAAGVAFHFKQWGEWQPRESCLPRANGEVTVWPNGSVGRGNANDNGGPGWPALRLGKKRAGRTLDGRTWDQMPRALA